MAPEHSSGYSDSTQTENNHPKDSDRTPPQTSSSLPIYQPRSPISSIEHSTGIDLNYGEKTWRPSQSIVDILQNHLDANTTSYGMARLELIDATEFDPSHPAHDIILEQLAKLQLSSDPEEQLRTFDTLARIVDWPDKIYQQRVSNRDYIEDLRAKLADAAYKPPSIKLKLRNGSQSKFVEYDRVVLEPEEWQVVGYLVADQGAGFDHKLLSMIGASTKKEDPGKRGGLGEGLKMSVAQLNRTGADIRIASENSDESWWLGPQQNNGLLTLEGKSTTRRPKHGTDSKMLGSRTLVDLSSATMSEEEWHNVRQILDLRQNDQGLGKYVLEYNHSLSLEKLDTSCRLIEENIPPGRVYVKGLLVEENRTDQLWSYNIKNKWAISGRDRSTVQYSALEQVVNEAIEHIDDLASLQLLVSSFNTDSPLSYTIEANNLPDGQNFSQSQKDLWQQAITSTYNYIPGKTLFCPISATFEERRIMEQRGYQLIDIRPNIHNLLELLKSIYNEPAHIDQVLELLNGETGTYQPIDPNLETEIRLIAQKYTSYDVTDVLDQAIFLQSPNNTQSEMFVDDYPFSYNMNEHAVMVDVNSQPTSSYARAMDVVLLANQVESMDVSFSDKLQLRLGTFVARALIERHPELLEINLSDQIASREAGESPQIGYKNELEQHDNLVVTVIELVQASKTLNSIENIKLFSDRLMHARQFFANINPQALDLAIGKQFPTAPFYFAGKLLSLNQQLEFVDASSTHQESLPILLTPGEPIPYIDPNEARLPLYFVPLPVQVNHTSIFSITTSESQHKVAITRTASGNSFTPLADQDYTVSVHNGNPVIDSGQVNDDVGLEIVGELLMLNGRLEALKLSDESEPFSNQLTEINQGEEYIAANNTLDYGGKVWADPRRIMLDAIQNHIDANHGQFPTIQYKVTNGEGHIQEVDSQQLASLDKSWNIISVSILDQGDGYTTPYLTDLGRTTKSDADAGKFGEGLKMLAASATLQGIHLELRSRNWSAKPTSHKQSAMNHETQQLQEFDMLGYNMQWQDEPRTGSQTTFSLFDTQLQSLNPEQRSQLQYLSPNITEQSNSHQLSQKLQIWKQWLDVLDPRITDAAGYAGLDKYIISPATEIHSSLAVSVLLDRPGQIFEKNLLVPNGKDSLHRSSPLMLGYNLQKSTINTRERNAIDPAEFYLVASDYLTQTIDRTVVKHILTQAKLNPQVEYLEYELLDENVNSLTGIENNKEMWRQMYYEVFGRNAILSIASLSSENAQMEESLKVHLERSNAIRLPEDLTRELSKFVYTTQDFCQELRGIQIDLTAEEKHQVGQYARQVNQVIVDYFKDMLLDPDKREYLGRAWHREQYEDSEVDSEYRSRNMQAENHVLEQRIDQLLQMTEQDISVGSSLNPFAGLYLGIENDAAQIEVNQSLINNPKQLLEVYIHEAMHHLSGSYDFELNFLRYFTALAVQAKDSPQKSSDSYQRTVDLQFSRRYIDH